MLGCVHGHGRDGPAVVPSSAEGRSRATDHPVGTSPHWDRTGPGRGSACSGRGDLAPPTPGPGRFPEELIAAAAGWFSTDTGSGTRGESSAADNPRQRFSAEV